jgi:hypothetical protein
MVLRSVCTHPSSRIARSASATPARDLQENDGHARGAFEVQADVLSRSDGRGDGLERDDRRDARR